MAYSHMEDDDDEFGDLYTDVLRPLTTSFQTLERQTDAVAAPANAPSSSHSRPIDLNINGGDDEIRYEAPNLKNSNSNLNHSTGLGLKLNALVVEQTLPEQSNRSELGDVDLKFNLNIESLDGDKSRGSEFEARVLERVEGQKTNSFIYGADDDDIDIVVEERDKDDDLVEKDYNAVVDGKVDVYNTSEKENTLNFAEETIPGLSGRLENQRGSNFEDDWESDSEDDLQIVLNDNLHGPSGMEGMLGVDDDDDEDGEPLVIVADNGDVVHHHQEWAGEEGGPGADGETKDLVDSAKATGGLGTVAQAAVQPRVGFGNQAYHHQFHSQFKYVRPGATPIPGTAPATQGASQVRPPVPMGRGRGDWRPAGLKGAMPMQKGFSPGAPGWGVNSAGRGYGSGLDFTLPSHKTIFEVEIDCFEEKPWKLPGIEVSDFFNFGLNEESWKDYRRQLEQLRLETSMQSKIRVYEIGRVEQDYDPDLPPELAAAAAIQDNPSERANPGKIDAGHTELARESARGRPPLPTGRPIPVDIGSSERLPSIDTRRPRMHDLDAIIEVICHSSKDDEDMADQQDNDRAGEDVEGIDEIDDLKQDDAEHIRSISHSYNGEKNDVVAKRSHLKNSVGSDEFLTDDAVRIPSVNSMRYQPDEETGIRRSTKGRAHMRSPKMTASDDERGEEIMNDQGKESLDSENGKQSSPTSSARTIGSDRDQTAEARDDKNYDNVMVDRRFDAETEEKGVDEKVKNALEVGGVHSTKIQKPSSLEEPLSQENDEVEDSKAAGSSENSGARSRSSNDQHMLHDSVEDEVLQGRRLPGVGDVKRRVGDEDYARRRGRHERDETERKHISVKGMENSTSRSGDPNSSLRRNMKSESPDWRKESDVSEGSLHWRDGDHYGRRNRFEDTRKTPHGGEIGSRSRGRVRESERTEKVSRNQLDNGGWRAANIDQDMGSRQGDRSYNLKSLSEKADFQSKKRREGAHIGWEHAGNEHISHPHGENSSRRIRERDDVPDQWKRDDQARLGNDDLHYVRQKEEGSFRKERNDRQRDRNEWDSLKQGHEEFLLKKERGETRPAMRNGRAPEDKSWNFSSRGRDEYRGSSREYQAKEVGRHSDQFKRRNRDESFLQQRGHEDLYAHGNQLKHDEKRARHERPPARNERFPRAADSSRVYENKQKESSRKGKDSQTVDHNFLVPSRRNQDEHGGQISDTVSSRGRTQQEGGENDIHMNRLSTRRPKEEASSDDEQPDSKKGRSKLERWTSHKDNDFSITPVSSSSLKSKGLNTFASSGASSVAKLSEDTSKKVENNRQPSADDKDTVAEINNVNPKGVEDKHLDTVAKLKKRSERFKLPMPREKDTTAIKKLESEPLPSLEAEIPQTSEIKSERPARKRRWTGS